MNRLITQRKTRTTPTELHLLGHHPGVGKSLLPLGEDEIKVREVVELFPVHLVVAISVCGLDQGTEKRPERNH